MSDYNEEDILKYLDELAGSTSTSTSNDNPNYYSSSSSNMTPEAPSTSGYDYLMQYADMMYSTGAVDQSSALGQTVSGAIGNPNYYSKSASNMTTEDPEKQGSSVIDKLKAGIGKAYDKDPLAFLKVGLDTVGGVVKAQRDRETADRVARSRIEEQNNAARIDSEKNAAYNNSFAGMKPRQPKTQNPLRRVGGAPVYDNGGRLIRS